MENMALSSSSSTVFTEGFLCFEKVSKKKKEISKGQPPVLKKSKEIEKWRSPSDGQIRQEEHNETSSFFISVSWFSFYL